MTTYYVADIAHGGSDSNSGTTGSPFLTLVKAWRACVNGDTIRIKTPGTWDGQIAKFHSRALAGTGTGGGADPVSGNSNAQPTGVTIQIDPATPTGTATFQIPVGTGWGKWRTEGQNNINLKYGYLWHWENPVGLTIDGLDADGVTQRLVLQDYADSTHRYDFYGAEGEYSSALALRRNGSTNEFCLLRGILVKQYGGQSFHFEGVRGCHWNRCATGGGQDGFSFTSDHDGRTANVLANGVGVGRGSPRGFCFEDCDGSRAVTTLASGSSRGDTSISVTSASGMSIGDIVVIFGTVNASLDPWGGEQAEVRKITNIVGNVLTLGGYRHAMTGEFLSTKPLRFNHASGVRVATQFGMEDCTSAYNGRSIRNTNVSTAWTTSVSGDDVGSVAITWKNDVTNAMVYHSSVHDNWTVEGDYDYNIDGGTCETFNMSETTRNVFNMNDCHDNHALWETGTNSGTAANGSCLMSENVIHGRMDFMDKGRTNQAATAGFALLRASRHWVIRSNTFYFTRGANSYGFTHDFGSGYSGPANSLDNVKIMDNLCVTTYDTQLYRWVSSISTSVGGGVVPPGEKCDYNLYFRTANSGANAAFNNFTTPQTFAYSGAGRSSFTAQTGLGAHDLWAVDPGLTDPNNNDFSLSSGSAARGAAELGDDLGAIPYVAPPSGGGGGPYYRGASPTRSSGARTHVSSTRTSTPTRTATA